MKAKELQLKTSLKALIILIVFSVFLTACITSYTSMLPGSVSVFSVCEADQKPIAPFVRLELDSDNDAQAKLFGVLKLKTVDVNVLENKKVYLGGMAFGVKVYTDGIIVEGVSEVDCKGKNVNPGEKSGILKGDIIKKINGKEIQSTTELLDAAKNSDGKGIKLSVLRGKEMLDIQITPAYSESEKQYKLGIWIKDGTAGIGTITYIDPNDLSFGGLGHGICDAESQKLFPMSYGKVCDVTISGVDKGEKGDPGELKGFFGTENPGVLLENTQKGVFGILHSSKYTEKSKLVDIELRDKVTTGPATILCTLDSDNICEYDIKIEKINKYSDDTKNFVIKVTDEKLLEKTGGIVQGMSGSPILQNGKLIGAVTHVLVNDPTRGYGIFIENMLETANQVADEQVKQDAS